MLQLSTGLRNSLLDGNSLKASLADAVIMIYTGAPPASANDAPTGTLLCTVTAAASAGINLGTADSGTITKDSGEVWSGTNVATGTAGYFRYVSQADDTQASSTTEMRMQGTCGTSGADLNMSSVALVTLAPQVIDAASFTMPASA